MKIFIRLMAIVAISIAILLTAGLITLKQGLSISELSILDTQINDMQLIWDNKLKLEIKSISVQPAKEKVSKKSPFGAKALYVRDALRAIDLIEEWFSFIDIKQVTAGPLNASFQYRDDENGQLTINSPQFELQARIHTDAKFLLVDIEKLSSAQYKSHAQGKARIDTDENSLTANFDVMIADTLPLQLELKADTKTLSFTGKGKQAITSIAPVVELFDLGPEITPWISEYLIASEISLASVSGTIPYNKPATILQTLHAVAQVKDTEYTFAQGLDPIKALETDVIFEQGILKIQPRNATFYGQDAGDSVLDINFNKEPFILTAYIRTKAQASGGILTLLDHYEIPLPFEQKKGLTDTDLTLSINLDTIDIDAKGTFKAEKSVFEYDQILVDVDQLDVSLNNTDITLHKLNIKKDKLISARVTGELDVAKNKGDLKASIDKFSFQSANARIVLDHPVNAPLIVKYHMGPDGDFVSAGKSSWSRDGIRINIGKFTTPFDPETLSGKLPPTSVTITPWLKTRVSGTFSNKPPYATLDIVLHDLKLDAFRLEQPRVQITAIIGDEVRLKTSKTSKLSFDKSKLNLMPTQLTFASNILDIHKSGLAYADQVFSDITGQIDFNKQTGKLQLDQFKLTDTTGADLLAVNKPLPVNLSLKKDKAKVNIPLLGIKFQQNHKNGWSLMLKDFARLNKFSSLMQDYKLQQGKLELTSQNGALPWSINGNLTYPLALIIDGNKPVHDYQFSGKYDGENTSLDINEKIQVKVADSISISSEKIGYNLPVLIDISKQQDSNHGSQGKAKSEEKTLELKLNATDSYLILNDRNRILVDKLQLSIDNGVVLGDLKYAGGFASLELKNDALSIVGKDFDKTFLNELLTIADFGKGELDFKLSGELDDMDAVFRIQDAVIKDYKTLNNMLAFINTVPALLTFKLPNYNRNGLPAKEIYLGANFKDGLINVKTVFIDSKELDLRGKGEANLNDDSIDMVFNLITGTKKSVGKIPLLGYVLVGDKKAPSITLTVKGDLYNPKIKHTVFKEVAAYPLNVIKNAVKLPGHLIKNIRTKSDKKQKLNKANDADEEEELY